MDNELARIVKENKWIVITGDTYSGLYTFTRKINVHGFKTRELAREHLRHLDKGPAKRLMKSSLFMEYVNSIENADECIYGDECSCDDCKCGK